MELKDFINKVVISPYTKRKFYLTEITSPYIRAVCVEPNERGYRDSYLWDTINGDPFETGSLVFADASLTEPFRQAYDAYCKTKDAYWEMYGYWMRKD